ncbi:MAG: biopolymer transporter ExbD [Bacteroidota bacterium]
MADVDTGGGGGNKKKGGSKTKKKSTKIDMTAMVDVAFLLLTFFVLTATMTNSAVMELTMPPKVDTPEEEEQLRQKIAEDKIMTIILDESDAIDYYIGIRDATTGEANFGMTGDKSIRKIIEDHLKGDGRLPRCAKGAKDVSNCWDPIFVVKPKDVSKYKNVVDLLDEFAITEAPKYAIDKFTEVDSLILIGEYNYDEEKEAEE